MLHFGYHAMHPAGSTLDVVLTVVSLGGSALLGIVLMLPVRARAASTGEAQP